MHAAGVIMSSEPLVDHIPVWQREADGAIITQFDYPACEDIGLLKMDFLGLRNLTVLEDAVAGIRANRGIEVDLDHLPLDDKPTYELLARGDTLGVFQLDGGPMRALLRAMRADKFEDISAVNALYRPGPMGQRARVRRPQDRPQAGHPDPPGAGRAAGRHPGRELRPDRVPGAGDVRRAAAGRLLARQGRPAAPGDGQEEEGDPGQGVRALRGRDEGATATPTRRSRRIWDVLVPFSDYAFNKAHAAGYALVSYWTAYLKANYPAEYMAGAAHLGRRRQGQVARST